MGSYPGEEAVTHFKIEYHWFDSKCDCEACVAGSNPGGHRWKAATRITKENFTEAAQEAEATVQRVLGPEVRYEIHSITSLGPVDAIQESFQAEIDAHQG